MPFLPIQFGILDEFEVKLVLIQALQNSYLHEYVLLAIMVVTGTVLCSLGTATANNIELICCTEQRAKVSAATVAAVGICGTTPRQCKHNLSPNNSINSEHSLKGNAQYG